MRSVIWLGLVGFALARFTTWCAARLEGPRRLEIATDYRYPELESRLVSLARQLDPPHSRLSLLEDALIDR
jgi:hypothetical protein